LGYEAKRAQAMMDEGRKRGARVHELFNELVRFAGEQMQQLGADNRTMGKIAAKTLAAKVGTRRQKLLTLCNTGFLACGPMGTALGVISHLNQLDRVEHVYAFETRPYLQGSRLTAFELCQEKVPHQIVV